MEQQKPIELKDIIRVLIANKWVYLMMLAGFFAVGVTALNIVSSSRTEYVSLFDYDTTGLDQVITENKEEVTYFVDGEKFNAQYFLNEEKLASYIRNDEDLEGLSAKNLIENNAIKSLKYVVTYKTIDAEIDNDNSYVVDKKGYQLVFNAKIVNKAQSEALAKAISKEIYEVQKEKIMNLTYSSYVTYFDYASCYSDKVTSLSSGISYLNGLVNTLKMNYGDLVIQAGMYGGDTENYEIKQNIKISDWQNLMSVSLENYFVDSMKDELELNGFIDESSTGYIASLKTRVKNLERQINADESALTELKAQRDDLMAVLSSTVTGNSIGIAEYNSEIIALTKKIADERDQAAVYQIQLDKLDKTGWTEAECDAYNHDLYYFNEKLNDARDVLNFYTRQYEAIARKVMSEKLLLQFDDSNVISEQGGLSAPAIVIGSFAIGIFGPMLVNVLIKAFEMAQGNNPFKKKASK